jgi:hypothetical protein
MAWWWPFYEPKLVADKTCVERLMGQIVQLNQIYIYLYQHTNGDILH